MPRGCQRTYDLSLQAYNVHVYHISPFAALFRSLHFTMRKTKPRRIVPRFRVRCELDEAAIIGQSL